MVGSAAGTDRSCAEHMRRDAYVKQLLSHLRKRHDIPGFRDNFDSCLLGQTASVV
jgi:hypothetical protein